MGNCVTQYIGARYVPLFADPIDWTDDRTYEPLTIVLHQGNSYTSRCTVPKGIDITDEYYWAQTGNYNAQVEQYRIEVGEYKEKVDCAVATVKEDAAKVQDALDKCNEAVEKVDAGVDKVNAEVDKGVEQINSAISNGIISINEAGNNAENDIADAVESAISQIDTAASDGVSKVNTAAETGENNVNSSVSSGIEDVNSAVEAGLERINDATADVDSTAQQIRDEMDQLETDVKSDIQDIRDELANVDSLAKTNESDIASLEEQVNINTSDIADLKQQSGPDNVVQYVYVDAHGNNDGQFLLERSTAIIHGQKWYGGDEGLQEETVADLTLEFYPLVSNVNVINSENVATITSPGFGSTPSDRNIGTISVIPIDTADTREVSTYGGIYTDNSVVKIDSTARAAVNAKIQSYTGIKCVVIIRTTCEYTS